MYNNSNVYDTDLSVITYRKKNGFICLEHDNKCLFEVIYFRNIFLIKNNYANSLDLHMILTFFKYFFIINFSGKEQLFNSSGSIINTFKDDNAYKTRM